MTANKAKPKKLSDYFIDNDARENGGWVRDVDGHPGVEIKTRAYGGKAATVFRDDLVRQRPAHLIEGSDEFKAAAKDDPTGHARELTELRTLEGSKVLEFCVQDWKGLPIPFSEQNLHIVCSRPEAVPLRGLLLSAALGVGALKEDDDQDAARLKNFVAGLGISFEPAS